MPRVVSITPLSVDRDSRTLKIAMSFASWGWHSIVVEGEQSTNLPAGLPISISAVRQGGKGVAGQVVSGRRAPLLQSANPVISLPIASAFGALFLFHHRWQMRQRIPEADLYYLHSFENFGPVRPVAKRTNARLIYDAHDFYSGIIPRKDMPPYRRDYVQGVLERLEQQCIRAADAVVTVGDGVSELIGQRFACRPFVVRNAHDSRLDRKPSKALRERLGIAQSDTVLVTVGNRKVGQAVDEAIRSLLLLPASVHLVLIGAGYEGALAEAASAGLHGRVHIVPPVSPAEIVPLIKEADIGFVLYWDYSENFRHALPNGFFQVVAAGLPLIHGGLPEITRVSRAAGTGVAVDMRNPAAIAEAVSRWLREPSEFASERAKALHAASEVTWAHEEEALKEVLKSIGFDNRQKMATGQPTGQD